jgi:hypothetical protein
MTGVFAIAGIGRMATGAPIMAGVEPARLFADGLWPATCRRDYLFLGGSPGRAGLSWAANCTLFALNWY